MRVSVIGCGMVGGALADVYEDLLAERESQGRLPPEWHGAEIYRYDPFKGFGTEEEAYKADIAFVCVPSPTKDNQQDLSAIHAVAHAAVRNGFKGTLVIKSTVVPGTTQTISDYTREAGFHLCHCPEFLREKTAYADLRDMKHVPISGKPEARALPVSLLKALGYEPIESENTAVTETGKYMHNVFCALKVTFCNEIAELCGAWSIPYAEVLTAAQGGERIGTAHTAVPGPDGKFGYGGACFPKDVRAFSWEAEGTDLDLPVIHAIEASNQTRRPHDAHCKEI